MSPPTLLGLHLGTLSSLYSVSEGGEGRRGEGRGGEGGGRWCRVTYCEGVFIIIIFE